MSSKPWSHAQQAVIAIFPKLSSVGTMIGSGWIIIEVLTHQGHHTDVGGNNVTNNTRKRKQAKRHHPYHRLLLAMSIYDILEAFWNFQSTWPIPEGTPNRLWATGTTGTCSAQGFFLQLALAVPIYNAFLAMYYMLVINYRFTEDTLVKYVEPAMHIFAGFMAFGTAVPVAFLGYLNDALLWCWIAPYPSNCKDTVTYGYPPENDNPCIRGNYAWILRYALYFFPLWMSIITATICTIMVYCKVRNADKRTVVYRRPEQTLFSTNSAIYNHSQIILPRESHLSTMSSFQMDTSSEVMMVPDSNNNGDTIPDNDVNVEKTPEQILLDEFKDIHQVEEEEDNLLLGQRSTESEPVSMPVPTPQPAVAPVPSPPGGGPQPRMIRFHMPKQFSMARISNALSMPRESSQPHLNPRSTEVGKQAILYLIAFYFTHVWSTTNRIYQQVTHGKRIYALILIHSWFDPFQGMLNFIVYQRPRYMIVRKKHPHISRWGAIVRVLHFSFMQSKFQTRDEPMNGNGTAVDDSHRTSSNPDTTPSSQTTARGGGPDAGTCSSVGGTNGTPDSNATLRFREPSSSKPFGLSIIREAVSLGEEHYNSSQEFTSHELLSQSISDLKQQEQQPDPSEQDQPEQHPSSSTNTNQDAIFENETQSTSAISDTPSGITDDDDDDDDDDSNDKDCDNNVDLSPAPILTMTSLLSSRSITIDDDEEE